MEEILQYVWKHKIFPLKELVTTDGRSIEVINPGILNHDAGPDFREAKIKIDDIEWVGNVEIHVRTSDWFRHGHDKDHAYNNIILHVANIIDAQIKYPNGEIIPQLELKIPEYIKNNYDVLLQSDYTPRCARIIRNIPTITIHSWMSSLMVERLEYKTEQIYKRREKLCNNWEDTFFVTIARNFGFGKNGDAFEKWAHSIPMNAIGKHRDNLFQIEAIFFGQAGLLASNDNENENYNENWAAHDEEGNYFLKLQKEYKFLRQKFSLVPIDNNLWRFLRLRPQNFPHIRIAQLAMLYYSQQINLSKIINATSIEEIHKLLQTQVSEFWETHYSFTSTSSSKNEKHLSPSSLSLLDINSIAPILFAYGKYKGKEKLCDFALDIYENTKPEKNHIISKWEEAGIKCDSAADTQALIQLTHKYCERHDCLRCRFGYEFISKTPDFLREKNF